MQKRSIGFIGIFVLVSSSSVVAGDLPKPTIQAMIKSLQDPQLDVRLAAAEALELNKEEDSLKALESALISSTDPKEQEALAKALIAINEKSTAKSLSDALANPQFTWGAGAKPKAVEVVGKIGDKKMIKWLTNLISEDQEPAVRAAAIRALGLIGAPPKKEETKK